MSEPLLWDARNRFYCGEPQDAYHPGQQCLDCVKHAIDAAFAALERGEIAQPSKVVQSEGWFTMHGVMPIRLRPTIVAVEWEPQILTKTPDWSLT